MTWPNGQHGIVSVFIEKTEPTIHQVLKKCNSKRIQILELES